MKELIKITDMRWWDGSSLPFKREDTLKGVNKDQIEIIKLLDSKLISDGLIERNGKICLLEKNVPKNANSILYIEEKIKENAFITSVYFCNYKKCEKDKKTPKKEGTYNFPEQFKILKDFLDKESHLRTNSFY